MYLREILVVRGLYLKGQLHDVGVARQKVHGDFAPR